MANGFRVSGINDMYFDWNEGLLQNKPAQLARGRFFYATDEQKIYYGKADGSEGVISLSQSSSGGSGTGDMLKTTYDTNDDGRVNSADSLSDGTNTVSALNAKLAVDLKHSRVHAINDGNDHTGVPGAVTNNLVSFDSAGLPKDSGKKASDFADALHTQSSDTITDFNSAVLSAVQVSSPVNNNLVSMDSQGNLANSGASKTPGVTFAPAVHQHDSTSITDFQEAAQDAAGQMAVNTTTANLTYNDSTQQLKVDVNDNTSIQKIEVAKAGALQATHKRLNFIEGSGVTINIADNPGSDRTDVTIASSGGGGTGDMAKSTYDTNNDGVVNASASLTDGTNTVTPSQAATAVGLSHAKLHGIADTANHSGIPGVTAGHIVTFDINGLPVVDSGKTIADFMPSGGAISITSSQVTDFQEAAQDAVGNSLTSSTTVTPSYNDASNQMQLNVNSNSSVQKVEVAKAGTLTGTRKRINFLQGSNVTINVSDDSANDKVDVQISAISGGGGSNYEIYADVYGVSKNGTTDDSAALQSAISNIGSMQCNLIITRGTYNIQNASLSFPSNINLVFEKGAIFQIASGRSVTMNIPDAPVSQIFSGLGLASVTMRSGTNRGGILPDWWYSGSGDKASAFNIAHTVASTINTYVFIPAGSHQINSTITGKAHMRGEGSEKSILQSGITNNTPVIQYNNIDRFHLSDFKINGSSNNWHGVQTINSCNRYYIENVYVANANIGFDLNGWIADLVNLWAYGCTTGLQGTVLNATRINFNCENSGTGILLKRTSGTVIDSGCVESCTVGIQIQDGDGTDTTQGITIQGTYHESNGTSIIVGATSGSLNLCNNVIIQGGKFIGGEIKFDNCTGGGIRDAFCYCPINVTQNARDVRVETMPEYLAVVNSHRNQLACDGVVVGGGMNLVPDPYFVGYAKGYQSVIFTRAKASQEVSNTYNGGGLRVEADSGNTNTNVALRLLSEARDFCANRRMRIAGWLYIPNTSNFTGSNPVNRPEIDFYYYDSLSTEYSTQQTSSPTYTVGRWNFFCKEIDVGSDVNIAQIQISVARGGAGSASAGDYVIVSGLFLGEAIGSVSDIAMGRWVRHAMAGNAIGKNIFFTLSSGSPGSIQSFDSGDRIINSAPTAGGTAEWICTQSGTTGSLSSVTGSITSGTKTLTVSSTSRLGAGMFITIAGVSGVKRVMSVSGSVLTLDAASSTTVSGAAVSYASPVFSAVTLS